MSRSRIITAGDIVIRDTARKLNPECLNESYDWGLGRGSNQVLFQDEEILFLQSNGVVDRCTFLEFLRSLYALPGRMPCRGKYEI